jgi:hypothetical protein
VWEGLRTEEALCDLLNLKTRLILSHSTLTLKLNTIPARFIEIDLPVRAALEQEFKRLETFWFNVNGKNVWFIRRFFGSFHENATPQSGTLQNFVLDYKLTPVFEPVVENRERILLGLKCLSTTIAVQRDLLDSKSDSTTRTERTPS